MPPYSFAIAEVQADRLRVADVEVAVRLGREARRDAAAVLSGGALGVDDLADEVPAGSRGRGRLRVVHGAPQFAAAGAAMRSANARILPAGRLPAEDLDHLEERGRREGAGEGEARGLGDLAELEARLGRERARGLLHPGVRERLDGVEARDERRAGAGASSGLPNFFRPAASNAAGSSP